MKTKILLIALLFLAVISNAQIVGKPASEWSVTTINSLKTVLDFDELVAIDSLVSPKAYVDSITSFVRPRATTVSDTLEISDLGKIIYVNSESIKYIFVPADVFPVDASVIVYREGVGDVEILGVTGVSFQSEDDMTTIGAQETGVVLIQRSSNVWKIMGRLK